MLYLRVVSQEEIDKCLATPFNPPIFTEEYTKESFCNEWFSVKEAIEEELEKTWNGNDYGDGDYAIGDIAPLSRGIGVNATSNYILQRDLIPRIQNVLKETSEPYEVYLSLGEYGKYGELFIRSDEVYGTASDDKLQLIGLQQKGSVKNACED